MTVACRYAPLTQPWDAGSQNKAIKWVLIFKICTQTRRREDLGTASVARIWTTLPYSANNGFFGVSWGGLGFLAAGSGETSVRPFLWGVSGCLL